MAERKPDTELRSPRREAFAQALARGVRASQAYSEAGYTKSNNAARLARMPEVVDRVIEIKVERAWTASRDQGPVILELLRVAKSATASKSAAGLATAVAALAQIARLKERLPTDVNERAPRPRLTEEEWIRRYGRAE